MTVSQVKFPSVEIATAMWESTFWDALLQEVMITSKDVRMLIRALRDITVHLTFDAWWALMDVGSNGRIVWNASRYQPKCRIYGHCRIVVTGSPPIICSVFHFNPCHSSAQGTSSMGNHFLANAHIEKITQLSE